MSVRALSRKQALAAIGGAAMIVPHRLAAQSLSLRVACTASDAAASALYAQEGGFFAKAGLNVELTVFNQTASQVIQAVVSGNIDAGTADMIQIGNAFNRGVPFAFFAGGGQYSTEAPTTMFCIAKSSQLKSARELNGQTVAVNGLGSIQELSLREWLRANGADIAAVKVVEIPPAAIVAALERGTIAGAMVTEPFLSASADRVTQLASPYDACARHFYINAWFANRDWLEKNADMVRRLRRAIYDAARWSNTHHDETLAILTKQLKLETGSMGNMRRAVFDTSLDLGKMQPVLDLAWRYKVLKSPITASQLVASL
jgi:NitT/TauT family transport system substrate-binding protein